MGCNCGGSRAGSGNGATSRAQRARPVAPVRERSKAGPGTPGYGSKSTRPQKPAA